MPDLNPIQRSAQRQFDRQSHRYGKDHILADVSDLQAVLERIPRPGNGRALDVATGGGHAGIHLASQGWRVTLSDISSAMLARARAAAEEKGLAVETRLHPAESLPYDDGSFDLVTCRVAPHHFSDLAAFVRESARVLKPGGHLVVIDGSIPDDEPEAEEWLHQVETLRDPSHRRLLSPRTWTRLCEEAGLQVLMVELNPFKQPDLDWYFDTAATTVESRKRILDLIRHAPPAARGLFRIAEENGTVVWWWQRLSLLANKV